MGCRCLQMFVHDDGSSFVDARRWQLLDSIQNSSVREFHMNDFLLHSRKSVDNQHLLSSLPPLCRGEGERVVVL